ncbi:MAG: hypothetical protein SH809_09975 [Rhodothermales bacterium]|nr:hypothetical protein [Rhodothermales bacterium]
MAGPRKRKTGSLEELQGILFEAVMRLCKIAESTPSDLEVQKSTMRPSTWR